MEEMLNVKEAMVFLGVKRTKLYKLINSGKLKIYRSKTNDKISLFAKAELEQLKGIEPDQTREKQETAQA